MVADSELVSGLDAELVRLGVAGGLVGADLFLKHWSSQRAPRFRLSPLRLSRDNTPTNASQLRTHTGKTQRWTRLKK